jgi:hypothetical protein
MYKNISAVLSTETIELIFQRLKEIETLMPFMVNLSPAERMSIPKLGRKSAQFVESAMGYSEKFPDLVPNFLNMSNGRKNLELAKSLNEIIAILNPLWEKINDTYCAVGAEAHAQARIFYKSVKSAARAGVPGTDVIVKELKNSYRKPAERKAGIAKRKKKSNPFQQDLTTAG